VMKFILILLLIPSLVFGGGSRSYDGVNDYVDVGAPTIFDNISPFTYVVWIFPLSIGENNQGHIIWKRQTSPLRGIHSSTLGANPYLSFGVDHSITDLLVQTSNDTITLNAWNHIVVSWDGSINASGVDIYINGTEATYQTTQNAVGSREDDAPENLIIGNRVVGDVTVDGLLSNFRLYNVALNAGDAQTAMNCMNQPVRGLIGQWSFLESGTNPTLIDTSGQGNNGTNNGTTESISGPPVSWCG